MADDKCPICGASMRDWTHFNECVIKDNSSYDFECTALKCGAKFKRSETGEKLQKWEKQSDEI
jgi:hypothetical protein